MPTVPVVRDNSVRQEGFPSVRLDGNAPLSAFGGGSAVEKTSDAARNLNDTITKQAIDIANKQKQNADEVRIQDADLQLSKAQTDIQLKAKQMYGKDAMGAPDYVSDNWKKTTDNLRAGLSNDQQRMAFDKIVAVRSADIYKSTQEHVASETKKYDTETTDAYLVNARNVAAINYNDTAPDGQIQQSIFLQEQAIRKYAGRYGIPEELAKQKIAEATSKTHTAVIDQMLSNHLDMDADQYYKDNKDAILPNDREKVSKAIEQGNLLGEGQRKADEIFAKYSGDRNAAFTYVKNHIKDPKLREQTENQMEAMFVRQGQSERAANTKNYQLASQLVEQNQPVPANIRVNLNATQQQALDRRAKQVNAGVQPNTDWTTYYNLKTMAAEHKNDFVHENLLEYRHELADGEFKDLVNLQGQLAKNDATAQVSLNGFRTSNQVVNDTLASAGINVKSKNPKEQAKIANFRRMVDENIQILQDQTNKKAKSEDVQKIADSLMINTVVKGGGWFGTDAKKRTFELEYKDIPAWEKSKIELALRRRGKMPSERSVLDLYIKGLEYKRNQNGQ